MAARRRRTELSEGWREKIKASMLINALHDHALGKCEMSQTQIRAAEILLKKVAPDLQSVEHSGEVSVGQTWTEVLREFNSDRDSRPNKGNGREVEEEPTSVH